MRLFCAVVCAVPAIARADTLTLGDARQLAERAAPEVALAGHRAELALAEIDAATALSNPNLGVTSALKTARLATTLSLPLPLFGQRATTRAAFEGDARAAALDTEATRGEARWATSLAWIDLWEAQSRAALLDAAVLDATRLAEVAKERFDAGSSPRVDVLRTAADLSRATADATQAHHLAAAAAARLASTLSFDPPPGLEAAGLPDFVDAPPPLDTLLAQAEGHPALRRERERLGAADLHVDAERRQRWPLVSPQVTLDLFDPTLPGPDFIFGLSLEVPSLNLRAGAIARARAQRLMAQTELAARHARLTAALRDGASRALGAKARLLALTNEVAPTLDEARQLTDEGYQAGYFDLLRVLDSRRTLLETRVAMVEARATWARAMADVERAAGLSLLESTRAP